jgi:hypothetical protein
MKNRKHFASALLLTLVLLSNVAFVSAQEKEKMKMKEKSSGAVVFSAGSSAEAPSGQVYSFVAGQEGQAMKMGDGTFTFVSSEMAFDLTPVKGAPYSADAVTESIHALADGNRIVRKWSALVYRDSEGRTRREETIKPMGPFGKGEEIRTVFINDPVTSTSYSLNSNNKTARKTTLINKIVSKHVKEKVEAETKAATEGAVAGTFEFRADGAESFAFSVPPGRMGWAGGKDAKKESLGTQMIEGVQAEGTRTTITIAAGEIGNEQPINIVSERWYSPELKQVVMSKQSDPRFGETTYRLTNINRSEPSRSLFEVPSDYTVQEGPAFQRGMRPGMRMRVKENEQ